MVGAILGTLDTTTTGRVVGGIVMGVLVVTMRDTVGCSVALLIGIEPSITGAVILFWEWGCYDNGYGPVGDPNR